MLDLKLIRKEPDKVKELLSRRDTSLAAKIDQIIAIDIEHRAALQEKQELETKRNQLSKAVGVKKSQGQAADAEMQELAQIKSKMQTISDKEPELFNQQIAILEGIPNLPAEDLIVGANEEANQEVSKWGEIPSFDFTALEHDEIGKNLDIFDFERGVKIAKSRFTLIQKHGAKLERALINFFLDQASQNGYRECVPPILVNSASLYGTGQLPKFAEDIFKVENEDLYLIPTAEVPLTNIYRDEILSEDDLPIYLCAYTPNFRSEAGSASKDTRGIIRQHQFNKIELVKLCKAEDSAAEHAKLTNDAESLLQALKLPYRTMLLCTGDMGFGASKCYDLEVWFPGQAKYREISSCSNFGDFQARRAQIRFKRDSKSKAELVHTINGSGLAVGRTVAAILENYQNQDGSVTVPMVLRPYLGNLEKIEV
ncbi:MAG: serine--tRNA ligase [Cyanobacteria bacterium]|nr:serine--tRNA ligase [Cyanobacteriota bacterium]MDA1019960.1 serine--tRNA ligase [Cyanobacteriota bacterium]